MLSKERIEKLRKTIKTEGETSVELTQQDFKENLPKVIECLTQILNTYKKPNSVSCYKDDYSDNDFDLTFWIPYLKTPEQIEAELQELIRRENEKIETNQFIEYREQQELARLMKKYPHLLPERKQ